MWRGSSHRNRSTPGTKVNCSVYWPHVMTFHANASSEGLPSGSNARGYPIFSAASEKASGTPLRVAVDAIGANLFHQLRDGLRPWLTGIARALIPHHHREEHANAPAMEICNHLLDSRNASLHEANHVVLIAIVYSHVGISRPN